MSKKRLNQPTTFIPGFRTVPSEIGKLIGKDFSPAVFDDPKMRATDLAYYVGDKRTIISVVPGLTKLLKHLPDGKLLFFHCIKDSLTKDELCDFFNTVCVDVPFKLTPDELYVVGTIPYSRGVNKVVDGTESTEHTYYMFSLENYEKTPKSTKEKSTDIVKAFEDYKNSNDELKQNDVSLVIAKKSELEKYFRRDKTQWNKLDDTSNYIVFFVYANSDIDEDSIAELYNNIRGVDEKEDSDVTHLGTIRRRYPQSGNLENYNIFVIKE